MKTADEWIESHFSPYCKDLNKTIVKVQNDAYNQALEDLRNSKGVFISDEAIDKLYKL